MVQTVSKTPLASFLDAASDIDAYDFSCKRLLAEKRVLARIMQRCLIEFRDYEVDVIAERFIEGTPLVSELPVDPDETGAFEWEHQIWHTGKRRFYCGQCAAL